MKNTITLIKNLINMNTSTFNSSLIPPYNNVTNYFHLKELIKSICFVTDTSSITNNDMSIYNSLFVQNCTDDTTCTPSILSGNWINVYTDTSENIDITKKALDAYFNKPTNSTSTGISVSTPSATTTIL